MSQGSAIAWEGWADDPRSTEGTRVGAPPLFERESEIALLKRVLDRAFAGDGRRLLVQGPAGKKYPSVPRPAPSAQALISTAVSQSDVGIGPPKATEG